MFLKQISAFIENKPGRLAEVSDILAAENINVHSISIADTADFGILRLIVSDADKALEALRARNLTVKATDVIAVMLEHQPGSLAKVLKELERVDISIEYMYAFTTRVTDHDAMVILRLVNQETSVERLKTCDIKIIDQETIKQLTI